MSKPVHKPAPPPLKILFILKRTHYGYGYCHTGDGAGGLFNSSKFVADMLTANGMETKLVVVTDNNDIDREVDQFRPDIVVIEALWVVPSKFDVLQKLHPKVKWLVSVHSNLPFLAHEGVAIEWITGYIDRGVYVGFNSEEIYGDMVQLFPREKFVIFLPNFYPVVDIPHVKLPNLHVGCFGAIRPLKNQLLQAVAAIEYANQTHQHMSFHVNASRCEQEGSAVLKNLRALFEVTSHQLVEHPWMAHGEFLQLMKFMDIAMAVSFSETFCIVAADAVTTNTPLICSDQIPWATEASVVSATDTGEIVGVMGKLLGHSWFGRNGRNRRNLVKYVSQSEKLWLTALKKL